MTMARQMVGQIKPMSTVFMVVPSPPIRVVVHSFKSISMRPGNEF